MLANQLPMPQADGAIPLVFPEDMVLPTPVAALQQGQEAFSFQRLYGLVVVLGRMVDTGGVKEGRQDVDDVAGLVHDLIGLNG